MGKVRFIPLHIISESRAPEDPTSAPVMVSKSFPSIKPEQAVANPLKLFSKDTITAISPPLTGMTIFTPNFYSMLQSPDEIEILGPESGIYT